MYYSVGDDEPVLTCTAVDKNGPVANCSVTGNIDTYTVGTYVVIYTSNNEVGTTTIEITYHVIDSGSGSSVDLEAYYAGVDDLTGISLRDRLYSIIRTDFIKVNYDTAKIVLLDSDRDLNTRDNIYLIYNGESIPAIWDDGATWNREHVWPNSRLGIPRVSPSTKNQGSDLHNLRAINRSVNSSRGNRYFVAGSGLNKTVGKDGYYPGDDHIGDVARILLYMMVMYPDVLNLTNDLYILDNATSYVPKGAYMGVLQTLLEWHAADPVDAFEIQRNNVIYDAQKNRNPFIDKPELVSRLFVN